ncbi:NAD-dependent epimerase/dehydratase family protein [Collibacillus ludicampi]|uniref:NAD-dependent epimerase/dehydratase family protein n=1 Tax=Collibacillus ludicampi TaxID=2771369 RepID=UPI0024953FCA|nr:NAD-dependent epimerase/dehydratase family protein [Collibacillus ludicampi]
MKVILFGGTGFIGSHVSRHLHESGYDVWIASRKDQHVDYGRCFVYRPSEIAQILADINSPYAIVNLAGESIQSGRWTDARKKKILHSRVDLTQAIFRHYKGTHETQCFCQCICHRLLRIFTVGYLYGRSGSRGRILGNGDERMGKRG